MKTKHNKKRNTMFLYEVLIRTLSESIAENNLEVKGKTLSILKEFFNKNTLLYKEKCLYTEIINLQNNIKTKEEAENILQEVKKNNDVNNKPKTEDYKNLDVFKQEYSKAELKLINLGTQQKQKNKETLIAINFTHKIDE
jgi:hypothetical protein